MRKIFLALCLFSFVLSAIARKPDAKISASKWEFVQNRGQWNRNILFQTKFHGGSVFFEQNSYAIAHISPQQLNEFYEAKLNGKPYDTKQFNAAAYRVTFVDAEKSAKIVGKSPYPYHFNYFIGNNAKNWASNVSVFSNIKYENIYNGVDLYFFDDEDCLKYEFHVAPNSDFKAIKLRYDGLKNISKKGDELILQTAVGRITELKPFAYQIDSKGDTIEVECYYSIENDIVTFDIRNHNANLPLIIDPTLVFSSYSGSTADNWGFTATYDSHGNLYGGGIVHNIGYPVSVGAYQINYCDGIDIAISKFDANGSFMHYSTYLGGSLLDLPHSMHVNNNDELYIFGTTGSANFPVTDNAFDTTFNGGNYINLSSNLQFQNGSDIFISKLSADGTQLLASTFVGGSKNDGLNGSVILRKNYADECRGEIIIDDYSNVYVVSSTNSTDFPVSDNVFSSNNAGNQEVCLFKMSQDLSSMIWSTYFGGSLNDAGYSMFLASDNTIYLCGGTFSTDLPTTPGAFQTQLADSDVNSDGFVAHFSSSGNLLQATYLGKNGYDQAYLIKGNNQDFPHIVGQTDAPNTQWVYNVNYYIYNGGQFFTKMEKDLSGQIWSTTFGTGTIGPDISPTALMIDYCDNYYISGWGGSANNFGGTTGLPVTTNAIQYITDNSDFYFICLSKDAENLLYASFFGGNGTGEHVDGGTSRFDKHGTIYQAVCAGCGGKNNFPTTPGAHSVINGSDNCNLGVIKIRFDMPIVVADFTIPSTICIPDEVVFNNNSQIFSEGTTVKWFFGDGQTSTEWNPTHTYTEAGVYEIMLIISDPESCNISDTLKKSIFVLSNTSHTLPTIDICSGEYTEIGIAPNPTVTYLWSPAESLNNNTISNPTATPETTTDYMLIATSNNCIDTIYQKVNVHFLNVLPTSGTNNFSICKGETLTLSLTIESDENTNITWAENSDFTNPIAINQTSIEITPEESKEFFVQISTAHCSSAISFNVYVDAINIAEHSHFVKCFDEDVNIYAEVSGGTPPLEYFWQFDDGMTSTEAQFTISPTQNENFTLTVTDALGCSATANNKIIIQTGTFPEPFNAWCELCEIFAYHETTLYSTFYDENYTYSWTPTQGVTSPNSTVTTAECIETTTFTVTVTDSFGCSLSDDVTIKVNPVVCGDSFIFIPNSFSPNGDGINDVLFVRSDLLLECHFVIYNRWGEKIFETDNQNVGWDGTFRNKDCQRGVYDYYFKGKCKDGEDIELKGNVYLVR